MSTMRLLWIFLPSLFLCGSAYENATQWDDSMNITTSCEAFFHQYLDAALNFTFCELNQANPFRVCTQCVDPYAEMVSLYTDLTTLPDLYSCMMKYLMADQVQIIPTVQQNAENLWDVSFCDSCISSFDVNETTGQVTYTVPEEINNFLILYDNMTTCIVTQDPVAEPLYMLNEGNKSILCDLCNESYNNLNDLYDSISSSLSGEVCMDVVDMMNYTRLMWSNELNCSHRSANPVSFLVVSALVAISPLVYYLPLRYTSQEKILRVFKQKRVGGHRAHGGSMISSDTTGALAAADANGRRQTPLSPIGT